VGAPAGYKLVNHKSTKSEKHWFKIITNQFQKLALAQEFEIQIQIQIRKTIIQNITDKRLCFKPYRLQMLRPYKKERR
jgi:hypothetical protein